MSIYLSVGFGENIRPGKVKLHITFSSCLSSFILFLRLPLLVFVLCSFERDEVEAQLREKEREESLSKVKVEASLVCSFYCAMSSRCLARLVSPGWFIVYDSL